MTVAENDPVRVEVYPVDAVPPAILAYWTRICDTHPEFANPFFRPQYAQAVGAVRNGVHVAALRRDDALVGIFPFERDHNDVGRPVGSRLSDFQAVIGSGDRQVDVAQVLRGCGLRRFHYDHWMADRHLCGQPLFRVSPSPYMDLSGGYDAYVAQRIANGGHRVRRIGQSMRKLEREVGEVTITEHDSDPAAWDALFDWKAAQYQRTGVLDILQFPWVRETLRSVDQYRDHAFRGSMMTLRAGGRLIAVHFGMRSPTVTHWWFPTYDAEYRQYSPGLVLLIRGAEYLAAQGCTRIDLGKGDEAYKGQVATHEALVAEGTVDSSALTHRLRAGGYRARNLLRRLPGQTYFKQAARFAYTFRARRDFARG